MKRMYVEEELLNINEDGTFILENVNDYDYLLLTIADYEGANDSGATTTKITKNTFDNIEYLTLFPLRGQKIGNLSKINDNLILVLLNSNGIFIQIIGGKY